MINIKKLIISLIIPLAVGGLSALLTGKDMDIYKEIIRPPFSPPSRLFPIAWTVLYFLMGISIYIVWNTRGKEDIKRLSFLIFGIQLFFNFIWSPIFFSARAYLTAFVVIMIMWLFIIAMIWSFSKVNKTAAYL